MRMNKSIFQGLILIAILLPLQILAGEVDDIRIVIDVSGSMKKTDPSNLRVPALKLLNGLVPTGSKAGVWTFGRYVNTLVKLGTVNDRWRKIADVGAAKIHSNGLYTNIESALKYASIGWGKPDKNKRRNLILLTDGQVDISKDGLKNKQSRHAVLTKSIQALINAGARVHAIALSKDTDEVLLKRLALDTGGSFEIAESAKDLQRIFFKMFERATQPDLVPLTDNSFAIDKSIKEMTLLVFKDKNSQPTKLFPPGGGEINQSKKGKSIWRGDDSYDLITIKKPKNGLWKIEAGSNNDSRVMVVTDLKLEVSGMPAYLLPNQEISFSTALQNKNKRISKNSFLKFVDFSMKYTSSDGTEVEMPLKKAKNRKDKGLYFYTINENLDEGEHEIIVTADSRTFDRSKRFNIQVQWPVKVQIKSKNKPGLYDLSISARNEYIAPKSLKVSVIFETPDGKQNSIQMNQSGNSWVSSLAANQQQGIHQVLIKIEAATVTGEAIAYDLGSYPMLGVVEEKIAPVNNTSKQKNTNELEITEQAEDITDEPNWLMIGIITVLVNLVLLAVVVIVFMIIRKKRKIEGLNIEDDIE